MTTRLDKMVLGEVVIKWPALKPRLLDLHYVGEHPLDLWWLLGGGIKIRLEA